MYMLIQDLDIVVIVIILANVAVSLVGFKDFSFSERFKFHIGGIRRGEQIRMLSSGFLHVDFMHLFFNMITLYFFAPVVINYLGSIKFLVIYFCSLIVGSLFSLFFHKDEYHYSAVGASGAVSGVIYSAILFEPNMKFYRISEHIYIPALVFGFGYLLFSIYGMKSRAGNIGHDAHFGGAVGGYVTTLILAPGLFYQSPWIIALLAVPIIILFVMQRLGKL